MEKTPIVNVFFAECSPHKKWSRSAHTPEGLAWGFTLKAHSEGQAGSRRKTVATALRRRGCPHPAFFARVRLAVNACHEWRPRATGRKTVGPHSVRAYPEAVTL